ncbi:MAG: phosphoribosylglycinamide formyltransferase [Kofleriaceae bacterium]|nr:phosphoribosylglycinamide formyltransferase [Kofleriaceae bacterium]
MRCAVLVSGSGSNLQALLDAQAAGALAPAEVVLVVSNRPGVAALERAARVGVPAQVIDHTGFADRAGFEAALTGALDRADVGGVVLAGFMRVLTADFVARFPRRIVNTHPSLLPAFPGTHAARQALAYGARVAGCTIHFVDASLDGGPIIAQATVPILAGDDEAALQRRIQAREHVLLPRVVRALAAGELGGDGRQVELRGRAARELGPDGAGAEAA